MSTHGIDSLERQLAELRDALQGVRQEIGALTRRVLALEGGKPAEDKPAIDVGTVPFEGEESVWALVGKSRVLPRVAMVCFVLVVALVLRTLTDSGVIGLELGVLLGLGYSASLVAVGWRLFDRKRRGRRVLPVCGVLLLCSVVLEAHGSFALLSAATAEWILVVASAVLTALGLRYRSGSVLAFAALSTSITGLAIGFPHPSYPHAAAVILAANGVAFLSLRVGRMQWLSWATFVVTVFLWLLWGFQANGAMHRPEEALPPGLHLEWYLPFVAAYALFFAGLAVSRAFGGIGAFHAFLPTGNVVWAYPAALAVVVPEAGGPGPVAVVGLGAALAHLALAVVLSRREGESRLAIPAFTIAGAILFALSSPAVLDSFSLALPLWSALACGIFLFSVRCHSTGLRLFSYGLQILVCVLAATTDLYAVPPASVATTLVAAAIVTIMAAWHYRSARRHPAPSSWWTTRIDRADYAGITMLWVAAISAFGLLRVVAFESIAASGAEVENTFRCIQSVVVNLASIALMVWGIRARNGEVLATAVMVAVFGGLKVVGADLLAAHGVPLVLSVASFGAAAAVGSIVLGKWLGQRSTPAAD